MTTKDWSMTELHKPSYHELGSKAMCLWCSSYLKKLLCFTVKCDLEVGDIYIHSI